jgi:aspartyl-tRNA(Asn)/glutamyl-tRNA(Gln) amidotransferase subunit C
MSALTLADVERIAALAHLDLTADEKTQFARQLADILEYAQQLQRVNTEGVPATAHMNAGGGAEREDALRPSLTPQQAVANAPDAAVEAGLFRVPRVIGG